MRICLESLRLKVFFKRIINAIKFVLFGEGWKSDLAFFIFIVSIISIIQFVYPYFFSVVYTNSMEHKNFNCSLYESFNISCQMFNSFPFKNGINVGDLVITIPTSYKDVRVGDVVVYISPLNHPILHRVVIKNDSFICIKGDNNPGFLPWECPLYNPNKIVGKAIFRIPYVGYIRIFISKIFRF